MPRRLVRHDDPVAPGWVPLDEVIRPRMHISQSKLVRPAFHRTGESYLDPGWRGSMPLEGV
ncbi:hypothetical protein [Janibacter sp. LM]|uniref:hypothetical protein n=1 Tax=Janibacter sp. LM TaxID=3144845 RepID=UPI0031F65E05